jgi:hypothetical protein
VNAVILSKLFDDEILEVQGWRMQPVAQILPNLSDPPTHKQAMTENIL